MYADFIDTLIWVIQMYNLEPKMYFYILSNFQSYLQKGNEISFTMRNTDSPI